MLKSTKENISHFISKFFLQDVKLVSLSQIWRLIIRFLIVTAIVAFFITTIIDGLPNYSYQYEEEIAIFFTAAVVMLFGGILTDVLITKKFSFEILSFIGIICILLMINMESESWLKILGFLLGIISALLLIMILTYLLLETNMLNRARITTTLFLIIGLIATPQITMIIIFTDYNWVWISIFTLIIISIFLSIKFPRERIFTKKDHVKEQMGFEFWIKTVSRSGAIPYFIFLFFVSLTVGFLMSNTIAENINTGEIITISIVGALSLPIIAVVIDKFGRKQIAYVMLFLIGLQAMFFDYPDTTFLALDELKIGVFGFTALLILTLTVVMAGDLSTIFSRGKIIGVLFFATVIGTLIGTTGRLTFFTNTDFFDPDTLAKISTWTTLIIFLSTFIFASTKETFEEDSPNWRDYLKKLYVISKFGVSLYSVDLSKDLSNSKSVSEDLVSGGLTGVQAMLQEISQSDKKIKSVDHGDLKIMFNYGEFSNVVLFATKDLKVYHEKLENFHLRAEYYNQDLLSKFNGDVGALRDLKSLVERYFR